MRDIQLPPTERPIRPAPEPHPVAGAGARRRSFRPPQWHIRERPGERRMHLHAGRRDGPLGPIPFYDEPTRANIDPLPRHRVSAANTQKRICQATEGTREVKLADRRVSDRWSVCCQNYQRARARVLRATNQHLDPAPAPGLSLTQPGLAALPSLVTASASIQRLMHEAVRRHMWSRSARTQGHQA